MHLDDALLCIAEHCGQFIGFDFFRLHAQDIQDHKTMYQKEKSNNKIMEIFPIRSIDYHLELSS